MYISRTSVNLGLNSTCDTGNAVSQVSSLQAENGGLSDASQGLDRERSAQDVLADILGDFGGSPPRSARPPGPSRSQGKKT